MQRSRSPFLIAAGAASALLAASSASTVLAAPAAVPAGYQLVDLNLGSGAFGVSPGGRLVTSVASGGNLTFTLYDQYLPAGRDQLGQVTVTKSALGVTGPGSLFATNIEFDGDSRIIFGENGSTSTLYTLDFAAPTPAAAALAPNGSFPGVQGIDIAGGNVIGAGSTAAPGLPGQLYLRAVSAAGGGAVTPVVQNVPGGYAGGTDLTPLGRHVLLDSNGVADLFQPNGTPAGAVPLAAGGGFGAYEIDFDNAGIAYVTTGGNITRVADIDGAAPVVTAFGSVGSDFHAGIAFTGGDFRPGMTGDTGALIVSDGIGERLYAIVVPEPTGVAVIAFAAASLIPRRRGRKGRA